MHRKTSFLLLFSHLDEMERLEGVGVGEMPFLGRIRLWYSLFPWGMLKSLFFKDYPSPSPAPARATRETFSAISYGNQLGFLEVKL